MKQNVWKVSVWEQHSHIVHFIEDGTRRNIFMLMALDSNSVYLLWFCFSAGTWNYALSSLLGTCLSLWDQGCKSDVKLERIHRFRHMIFLTFFFFNFTGYLLLCELSLVAVHRGYSPLRCVVLLQGFSCHRAQVLGHVGFSGCGAWCEIFLDQEWSPCPLHWQVDSYPLHHWRSPRYMIHFMRLSLDLLSFPRP